MRPRVSASGWEAAGRRLLPLQSGMRGHGRRSRRVGPALVAAVLAVVAMLATTGCIRLDLNVIVRDSDDGEFNGRFTVAPLLVDMLGGVDALEESVREAFAEDEFDIDIRRVHDSDDWQGIAFEGGAPQDLVIAGVSSDFTGSGMELQEIENGWRFSLRDENPFSGAPSVIGFRFRFSVSLPGELESSNADSTETRGGMTTARWETTDPNASLNFQLVTDTSRVAGAGGLGTGAIVGIVVASTVAAGLAWLWWLRRAGNSTRPADESEEDPATPENAP